ncbi:MULTISPECIES: BREX-3 system P-loop-containing protein BrxF [unclassified Thiocapsa]|uniref:BREX-3 system P-loop-containing protein BrxF n=1 Tax=unclassified Thiocapsa TaxID=2641286 RepID=UPI0035B01E21
MLTRLSALVDDVASLHNKLILLVGPPGCGKTALLAAYAEHRGVERRPLGSALGRRLAALPRTQRHLLAGTLLREIAETTRATASPLLVDNIELLFDASLKLNPLALLKRLAQARVIVAVWPGELRHTERGPRLTYAEPGHPEYRDDALDGVVTLDLQD